MFPKTTATAMQTTYYIYGLDGKVLAEYDQAGSLIKNNIYVGNRLAAEYNAAAGKWYYYTPDQINSTRVVTDQTGAVVYSAAYDPYGGTLKTWTNTMTPQFQFSGKERESASGDDYFGARYYNHSSYRWLSVDPVLNKAKAIETPQLWNLYTYCHNNPISGFDPDGRDVVLLNRHISLYGDGHNAILIGNESNGWRYYSKNGEASLFSGADQNSSLMFHKLDNFNKSEIGKKYSNKFHLKTSTISDIRMLQTGRDMINIKYDMTMAYNENGTVKQFNCADFVAFILKAGGINVGDNKESIALPFSDVDIEYTSPDKQYDDVKNKNKGEEIKN